MTNGTSVVHASGTSATPNTTTTTPPFAMTNGTSVVHASGTSATPNTTTSPPTNDKNPTPTQTTYICQNNTRYADNNGRIYTLYCDANAGGGLVSQQNFAAGGYNQCEDFCDAEPGCGAWVWAAGTNNIGGECYLENLPAALSFGSAFNGQAVGIASSETQFTNRTQCPAGPESDSKAYGGIGYTIYCGNDTSAGGYASSSAKDYISCQNMCDAQATGSNPCTAFTFAVNENPPSDTNNGTCYLKGGTSTPSAGHGNFIAGIARTS
ncbi:hypothetical protein BDY17DRAFT_303327 [Neohortaea acidophila]|uniref:Apple domain-containing protein n=1 Tax=Neohortaea acidophila TaxID=245834 RepID=A0A6A6PJQ0_9PEZI|nr:uncharacterized protein BDY17DRAFT_303327 [Neohortaea acidophila]KAF2480155.1 hypothetical protein BDY17DRAFT_303327 [Neohortaea acidophila]